MNGKKLTVVFALIILLVAGWGLTVKKISGVEEIKKQSELAAEADVFFEKKLYVRAIPLYEEAAGYTTQYTADIQEKLLSAYVEYKDEQSYAKLVERRVKEGTASEEEYLNAAKIYLESSSKTQAAMELLQKGIEKYNSQELIDYYESIRYLYSIRSTGYQIIKPTDSNEVMPAYDGEHWGYVNKSGGAVLDFIYDDVTVFSSTSHAVVRLDDVYYNVLGNGDHYGVDDGTVYAKMENVSGVYGTRIIGKRNGTYSYFNYDFEPIAEAHQYDEITINNNGCAAVKKGDKWGIISDSGSVIVDFILDDVAVNSLGSAFAGNRAMVKENGSWYMINNEGKHVTEDTYAAVKAPEGNGYIAVANRDGKWGYIDKNGNQMIDFQYWDAKSFSEYLGAVQVANNWGYISRRNELVIPDYFEEAEPFHGGIAQVRNIGDITVSLITLKNYEEE
ncbi:MAG: WG repeat-containing protein [Alistipes sp.]|nr:WG repeat-containing protein [Alistipes sp.]